MTGKEYTVSVYRASKHGRYEYRRDWTFTIVPLDVVKMAVFSPKGELLDNLTKLTRKEKNNFLNGLKEFLFRKVTAPVGQEASEVPSMWHIHPEFDEETKREVKRMYLFDEL